MALSMLETPTAGRPISPNESAYLDYRDKVKTSLNIIQPTIYAFAEKGKYVTERFALGHEAVEHLKGVSYSFGFNGFGEAVYYRTYSRLKADSQQENWVDTVIRVVNGIFSIRKDWYTKQGLPWKDSKWQYYAREFATYLLQMKWLPPGRGLWAMGTDYIYERGAMALYNCAATKVHTLSKDLTWLMDLLMCGCGVGIECVPKKFTLIGPNKDKRLYIVPDTREGWVESVRLLFESYEHGSEEVVFDYGLIRDAGELLRGMGGVSAGPNPLIKLHEKLRHTLAQYMRGEFGATRLVADSANHIGICVVVGNVRRSSEILIGEPGDDEFMQLKNYEKNPDRAEFGWMSNNTIRLSKDKDFEILPQIAERVRTNGEPGFMNLIAAQKFARFGREKSDAADLLNPCQPGWATVLTPEGERTFSDIDVGSIIWSGKRWTTVVRKEFTGVKPVFKYKTDHGTFVGTEEHRIVQLGEKVKVRDATHIDKANTADDISEPSTSKIKKRLFLGEHSVYDITVDDPEHTYWSGGLLVSNCGEILLEDKELCNISEVFPGKCNSEAEFLKACEFAAFYCSTVSLLPTHRPETNAVVQRNRRIGVSNSGITEWMETISTSEMTRWLRAGYKVVEETNRLLAREAGVPPSIRITTVKPSGTISQLVGVPSGVHFPLFDYAIRCMRVAAGSAIERILRAAGYVVEKDTYAENTSVVEFPIDQGRARKATDVSVWEQALMLCMMQREWADNSVSVTLYFDPETEGHQLEHLFSQIAPMVKAASALPHTKEGVYLQAPYSGITKEEYERRVSQLKPINWAEYRGDGQDDKYCNGDTCEIKPRK